ncbi:hypothetical protein RF11_08452 [Thelohanellus kitauei]|uniref:Uncharacterized protein n=1 Tax=Thelohanellus kitauei TaxID=669202 RepID=A0A0C2MF94_THEKT|nr:hypothetical protein RF11_08452 [Thelohanellus kitauei]
MKKSAELKRQAVQDPATKTVSPQRKKPEKKTVSKSTITDESIRNIISLTPLAVTTDNISQEVATHAKTKFVEVNFESTLLKARSTFFILNIPLQKLYQIQ